MSEKVVPLPGHTLSTLQGQPVVAIVDMLRDLIARAEAGSLTAISVAAVIDGGTPAPMVYAPAPIIDRHTYVLVAASCRAHRRLCEEVFDA